ncbi:hypothetical protein ASG11_04965 [Sphingomonas sp. Leaf357]|uniref:DUF6285 domain-containing protein n=1 Tax=Sphingomonas sp. Leaf357 TaxID=1736350 RepID=UPI0006F5EA9A|nr:DUF6285 domain-containing protein [Sphingomonas sp. Leaf357]KQS03674.1 hypothetical protein ASG11_04965 [Sphingomonas sp. Leaf357]
MQDRPAPDALLDIVEEFLRSRVLPETSGHTAFHLRVAINVLALVRREITLAPGLESDERDRLIALIGGDADTVALNAALCDAIADGRLDSEDKTLHAHLWQTTLEKMAVDQPRYAAFVEEISASPR